MTDFIRNATQVENVRWGDAANTWILMDVKFAELEQEGFVPFAASPKDPEAHGVDLYNRAVTGEFGLIAEYAAPAQPE